MHLQVFKLATGAFLIFLTGTLVGCAGGTVMSDLPPSHPAHPLAPEAAYHPPPNPFQSSGSEMHRPDADQKELPVKKEHQGKMSGDHAGHSMEQGPESSPAGPSKMDHTRPEHGGHDQ